jgi:hypothetical protein
MLILVAEIAAGGHWLAARKKLGKEGEVFFVDRTDGELILGWRLAEPAA